MNRTKTLPCPVCGKDSKDRRWYDGVAEHRVWSKTHANCQECGYLYQSGIFEPYTVEVIGHVMIERELFAADDRNIEKMEERLVRQHVYRLDVLQEGKELVLTKEYLSFRSTLSFANANQDYARKRQLEFLKANKDKFPLNYVEFRRFVKFRSENRKEKS